jgi:hypothetical protein
MSRTPSRRLIGFGVACATLGAGAGAIANAGATGQKPVAIKSAAKTKPGAVSLMHRAVHAEIVVADKGGGFSSLTFDRGILKSVSGDQVTLAEGTRKATYKTVTLTVPAGADVRANGGAASLGTLKPGQRVAVVRTQNRTLVRAHDARAKQPKKP